MLDPAGAPVRVRVAEHEVVFVASEPDAIVLDLEHGGRSLRASLVAREKGGFDVGLADRVLRVACEALEA